MRRLFEALRPGGALLLAEKIRYEDEVRQAFMTELHHDFKKHQGYSDLEIARKRAALENVLTPDTEAEHLARLRAAGFRQVELCLRCINFSTFIGVRHDAQA